MPDRAIYRRKAEFLKAIAHPLRIRALELLVGGEKTVGQLVTGTGAEPSHLSQQLGILRTAGVVSSRREGSNVYYTARDPRIFQLLATAKAILTSSLEESGELLADLQGLGFGEPERGPSAGS
jgi:DNA-binding transcriptional ArsR family regulator